MRILFLYKTPQIHHWIQCQDSGVSQVSGSREQFSKRAKCHHVSDIKAFLPQQRRWHYCCPCKMSSTSFQRFVASWYKAENMHQTTCLSSVQQHCWRPQGVFALRAITFSSHCLSAAHGPTELFAALLFRAASTVLNILFPAVYIYNIHTLAQFLTGIA